MKCLSLWQPWASLLVSGAKRVETRSRPLPHRGPLLIHAAKMWNADLAFIAAGQPFRAALERAGIVFEATEAAAKRGWGLPFGAIVGRVDVLECYPTERVAVTRESRNCERNFRNDAADALEVTDVEWAFGDYSPGRFAFLCGSPVRFAKPVPCRGHQALFEVPDELVREATK